MDIVERTGSGVYDVELKARLGDLSGVVDTINGTAVSGFGLYTDNAFLKGGIVATYGSIGGLEIESNKIYFGTGTYNNSNTEFYVDNSGQFSLGNKLSWNGSTLAITGDITVSNPGDFAPTDAEANPANYDFGPDATFDLNTVGTPSTNGLYLGSDKLGFYNGGWKTYMDNSGQFFLSGTGGDSLSWNGSTLNITGDITITNTGDFAPTDAEANDPAQDNPSTYSFGPSADFTLTTFTPSTAGLYLGSSNMGYYNGGWKTYMDSSGQFFLSGTGADSLSWNGSTLAITGQITVGSTTLTDNAFLDGTATNSDVGLGNVQNLNAQNQAQTGLIAGTTITGGGITLNAGGNIKGGQTAFNSGTGFFIGYESGQYVFSIGNASSKGITWNGATLAIGGDVQIGSTLASTIESGAALGATSNQDSTATIRSGTTSTDVGLGNVENFDADGQIQNSIGNLGGGTTITGGGITLSSGGIIKGGQTAFNSGNGFFIGFTGGQYKFSIGDGSTKGITWDGATMTIAGNVTIGSTIASSIESQANSALQTGDNVSELTNNSGYQNATDVNTADKTSGTVGAWTISPTTISNGNVELNASTEKIKLGSTTTFGSGTGVLLGKDSSDYELYAGNGTQYLWWNGSSLVVKGQVNATSGNFTSTVTIGEGATTGTLVVGEHIGGNKINIIGTDSDSTTKIAASNGAFEMKADGTATFANGNITFENDGDITSQDFLIERTRLFGAGEDGSKTLTDGVGTITSDDDGGTMFTESSGVFTQQRDIYCDNLTLDNSAGNVTLKTNGYRIFVKDTLTIESGCVIHNDGTAGNNGQNGSGNNTTSGLVGGSGGSGGPGAPSGTLKGGIAGASGGEGGSVDSTGTAEHKASGGGGGGAGGSGGIVLIVARNISNSGTIRCNGGAGGNGGNGGFTTA